MAGAQWQWLPQRCDYRKCLVLELSSKIFRVPKMLTFDVMAVNLKMPGQSLSRPISSCIH